MHHSRCIRGRRFYGRRSVFGCSVFCPNSGKKGLLFRAMGVYHLTLLGTV
jgi:hypothetical protein